MEIYKAVPLDKYNKCSEKPINLDAKHIIALLNPDQKSKAQEILSILSREKDFGWNASGEIILKDKTVRNSNIIELISLVTQKSWKRNSNIIGLDTFLQALKEYNIPQNLFTSEAIHQNKQKWITLKE